MRRYDFKEFYDAGIMYVVGFFLAAINLGIVIYMHGRPKNLKDLEQMIYNKEFLYFLSGLALMFLNYIHLKN